MDIHEDSRLGLCLYLCVRLCLFVYFFPLPSRPSPLLASLLTPEQRNRNGTDVTCAKHRSRIMPQSARLLCSDIRSALALVTLCIGRQR
jgi:hypothetical protein